MSIRPPTDIVLDVARAADPAAYKIAAARLDALGATSAFASVGDADAFASVFEEVAPAGTPSDEAYSAAAYETALAPMPFNAAEAMTRLKNNAALADAATGVNGNAAMSGTAETYRSFEAMIMSTFVESMLPKSSEAVFGSGSAGEIWRSMFAQQIALQIANAGGIGIADQLAAATADRPAT